MKTTQKRQPAGSVFYQDSLTHLIDELRNLDARIRRHIETLRPQRLAVQGMMASKGVFITHEEVDALLDQDATNNSQPDALFSDRLDTSIADKIAASAERGIFLSLPWVAQIFSLSQLEVQIL